MRKLLLILLIFVASMLLLISFYHTFTNISLQVAIDPLELPKLDEQASKQRLAGALKIPVLSQANDSLSQHAHHQMRSYLKNRFPRIFNHPNIQVNWMKEGHWVLHWKGRDTRLQPWLVLGHYDVADPPLKQVPKWTYNPFVGKMADGYIWGAGALSGKTAMLATLEGLQRCLQRDEIPNRSLYLAFVADAHATESKGWEILAKQFEGLQFESIQFQKSYVYEQICLDFEQPLAMIGCASRHFLELELKGPDILSLTDKVKTLVDRQGSLQWRGCATDQLLNSLTPELPFFQKWMMSNRAWLGGWMAGNLRGDSLLGPMLQSNLTIERLEQPDSGQATALLRWELSPDFSVEELKKEMAALFEKEELNWNWLGTEASWCSSPADYGYGMLQTSIKQVIDEVLIFPAIADCPELGYFTNLSSQCYAFHPLSLHQDAWNRQQQAFDERISEKDYFLCIHFYEQLFGNVL